MSLELPKTLMEAVRYFTDLDLCHEYMVSVKWPDGRIVCPTCGGDKIGRIDSRRLLRCNAKGCRKQFSAKVGTIFEDSPLGLDKWFVAVWVIANCKNGISSCEVGRALGVTQKTAWFMLHRIRMAMKTGDFKRLSGQVESDETYVGGKSINMHARRRERIIRGRGAVGKAIVHGALQRSTPDQLSRVVATVVADTDARTLLPILSRNVDPTATVFTDAHASYQTLWRRWVHSAIDHATRYVSGVVHINGIENFWSLLKRAIKGSYVHVAEFHLCRYVDEEAFRFNERGTDDGGRFRMVLQSVLGKRLTWRQLTCAGGYGWFGGGA